MGKICKACLDEKDLNDFPRARRSKDGRYHLCRDCNKEACRSYKVDHAETVKAGRDSWRGANRDHNAAYMVAYYAANADARKAYQKTYRTNNRAKRRVLLRRYKARRKAAEGHFTAQDIRDLFTAQRGLCFYCAAPLGPYHIDHKNPVSRGGSNWPDNLALACPGCNYHKSSKTADEFMPSHATPNLPESPR